MKMINNILLVGGDFGENPRPSSLIEKAYNYIREIHPATVSIYNGGYFETLKHINTLDFDLIFWMPNVSNENEKIYPKKSVGAVLICSKVLHDDVTEVDAVSRIFKMNGNAVIAINKSLPCFEFKLIDALGNTWAKSIDIADIFKTSISLSRFYAQAKRYASERKSENINVSNFNVFDLDEFMQLNRKVAKNARAMGGRYFGNCSTRCWYMFPTIRTDNYVLVSPRNFNKGGIEAGDMVVVDSEIDYNKIKYYGNVKPSVDTPVQLMIYEEFKNINFMIHGHYYIYGAPFSKHYYSCGDTREFDEIYDIINNTYPHYSMGAINLINHGFLLYSSTIEEMQQLIDKTIFIERKIGKEQV